jgi:hypothetical protein
LRGAQTEERSSANVPRRRLRQARGYSPTVRLQCQRRRRRRRIRPARQCLLRGNTVNLGW